MEIELVHMYQVLQSQFTINLTRILAALWIQRKPFVTMVLIPRQRYFCTAVAALSLRRL